MPGEFLVFRYGAGLDLDKALVGAVGIEPRHPGVSQFKAKMLGHQILSNFARDPEWLAGQAVVVDGGLLRRFEDWRDFLQYRHGQNIFSFIESGLFGHEPGAFTGAVKARIGKFEHAAGGIVFLDEIESMPLDLQIRLLRVLQERKIERLGSNREIPLDIRVLAATKRDLLALSAQGGFREDLYYRLGVVTLITASGW